MVTNATQRSKESRRSKPKHLVSILVALGLVFALVLLALPQTIASAANEPTLDDVLEPLRASGARRVYLAPLMIVAGDHAKNDLAGDDSDSWANRLQEQGFETEPALKGLGEYAGVRKLVCAHALAAQPVEDCGAPAGE